MAIVNPGEKLPATYLERFDPAENVVYRFSVLSTSAIAVESHWVDVPSKNIKGVYQCLQGTCCQALGRRSQAYNVPIYVYRRADSTEGDIYVWQMTPARWKKFSDLALQVDLLQWDLTFSAQKRGQGMDWNYSILPDVKFRDYWSAEQKEQLNLAVQSFYQMGESSLVNPMSYNDWAQLLYDLGYDVQNQCWPGGQSPMNSGASFGAMKQAVGVGAVLPPPPPAGYFPSQPQSHPQVPNIATGVIMQPAPLQSAPAGFVPSQPQRMVSPSGGAALPGITGSVMNQGSAPLVQFNSSVVKAQPSTSIVGSVPVVPLGTAPNVPVSQGQSQGVPSNVPTPPPVQNTIPSGVQEITSEELNAMLSN